MFSVLFADDTTGLAKGANLQELISFVNLELQKMANWFRSNKMQLNASKLKPNTKFSEQKISKLTHRPVVSLCREGFIFLPCNN